MKTSKQIIKEVIDSSFLTVQEVSDISGIPKSTIEQYLYHRVEPPLFKFQCIVEACGARMEIKCTR